MAPKAKLSLEDVAFFFGIRRPGANGWLIVGMHGRPTLEPQPLFDGLPGERSPRRRILVGLSVRVGRPQDGVCRLHEGADPAVAEVARDLREAHVAAPAVVQRCDDHICPETRSAFAHTPPFVLETAVPKCAGELEVAVSRGDLGG